MTGATSFDVEGFRARVDDELRRSVASTEAALTRRHPGAGFLASELGRLVEAGGSHLRPTCCALGFRCAGGDDGPSITRAAAALEFLHLMALVHDDVMDDAKERRGMPSTHVHLAQVARAAVPAVDGDAEHTGRSLAILVGDLAGVCADLLFAATGFAPERLARALERYHAVRLDMAAGQALDVLGTRDPFRVAALKGGSYTIAGPLLVGAALAGAPTEVERVLIGFGEPLGTAFQLKDDLRDGEAGLGVDMTTVVSLVAQARNALEDAPFDVSTLDAIAGAVEAA